jgi:H+-transporting ATPase
VPYFHCVHESPISLPQRPATATTTTTVFVLGRTQVIPEGSLCQMPSYAEQFSSCVNWQQGQPSPSNVPSVLMQCRTEQKYIRGAMMRSLLYVQVSISGQALVFVVRTVEWSLASRAGMLTYVAFFAAQVGATLIGIFGFGGYVRPRDEVHNCQFCGLSTGGPVRERVG